MSQPAPHVIQVTNLVGASSLPKRLRLPLIMLASFSDPDGSRIHPSDEAWGQRCGMSDKSLRPLKDELLALGIIEQFPRPGTKVRGYVVHVHRIPGRGERAARTEPEETSAFPIAPDGRSGAESEETSPPEPEVSSAENRKFLPSKPEVSPPAHIEERPEQDHTNGPEQSFLPSGGKEEVSSGSPRAEAPPEGGTDWGECLAILRRIPGCDRARGFPDARVIEMLAEFGARHPDCPFPWPDVCRAVVEGAMTVPNWGEGGVSNIGAPMLLQDRYRRALRTLRDREAEPPERGVPSGSEAARARARERAAPEQLTRRMIDAGGVERHVRIEIPPRTSPEERERMIASAIASRVKQGWTVPGLIPKAPVERVVPGFKRGAA